MEFETGIDIVSLDLRKFDFQILCHLYNSRILTARVMDDDHWDLEVDAILSGDPIVLPVIADDDALRAFLDH